MKHITIKSSLLFLAIMSLAGVAFAESEKPFAPNVDLNTGAISVPEDYTLWPTLGTWTHTKIDGGAPNIHEYHVVYTQPKTIKYYKKKRRFPDGAVLVKELLHAETMSMTTGPAVGHATTLKGFFVLVRDTKGRFKSSPLWGDAGGGHFSIPMIASKQHPRIIRLIVCRVMCLPRP
ncbi:MAG: cytochrome P460 family protein [Nitrospirota bacterium]|nr:cytochrome P460 family protein [Nitrospirota bacterium]